MIHIKRVLVPIDFSEFSDRALQYGKELCKKFDAELHLLHALEVHVTGAPQFSMGLAVPERVEESSAEVMQELNKLPGDDYDLPVERSTAQGSPFLAIVNYAKENDIDLIALGTHGRSGLNHVFLGSVAENVARQAPCPVLIVRKDGHQFVSP